MIALELIIWLGFDYSCFCCAFGKEGTLVVGLLLEVWLDDVEFAEVSAAVAFVTETVSL